MSTSEPAGRLTSLADALHAAGPIAERADQLALFGQFVGSWHLHWTGQDPAGEPVQLEGELHVGWVLAGRAVQDVWIVPGRGHPAEGQAPGFHGTTIRFYDPALGAWQSTWIDPPNGRVRHFIGRPAGSDIELISDDQQPALRWRFTAIRPDVFEWIGEIADQDGSWQTHQHMHAVRVMGEGG